MGHGVGDIEEEGFVLMTSDEAERFVCVSAGQVVERGGFFDALLVAVDPVHFAAIIRTHHAEPVVEPTADGIKLWFKPPPALCNVGLSDHAGSVSSLL